jgi:hypothetical protein
LIINEIHTTKHIIYIEGHATEACDKGLLNTYYNIGRAKHHLTKIYLSITNWMVALNVVVSPKTICLGGKRNLDLVKRRDLTREEKKKLGFCAMCLTVR